jgi:hypothetical protein
MFYKAPELSLALSHWMGRDLTKTCPANQCSPIHAKDLSGFVCVKKVMRLRHLNNSKPSAKVFRD